MVEAVTEPELVEQVEREALTELEKIRDSIRESEIDKARQMSRSDYAFGNEKVISIANTYGYSRIAATIEHAVHYLEKLESVTRQDIEEAIDQILVPRRLCKALLLPAQH